MTRAAVLGSPIAHSLSPALHRAAYAALGLTTWAYDAVELVPDALPRWLAERGPEWAGLSLTMPLKQTVLPLLDELSDLAAATGAANTVLLGDGRRRGDNTDVHGIVAALAEAGVTRVGRGAVIGAGATAASALAALAELGEPAPTVLLRDPTRSGPLLAAAERLGVGVRLATLDPVTLLEADVVISTTPAGATDALADALPEPPRGALLDVTYAPWPTRMAQAWGGPVIGGAVMLLHQAARQVTLMTGHDAPLEAMRAALPVELLS